MDIENIYSYDCLLYEYNNIQLMNINIDNADGGCIVLTFVGERKDLKDFDGLIKCKFNTYIFVKSIDEYYDASEKQFVVIENNETVINKFGPVISFKEAPWFQSDKDRKCDFDFDLPNQYHFITMDDIIDVLSLDKPEFWVEQKKSTTHTPD